MSREATGYGDIKRLGKKRPSQEPKHDFRGRKKKEDIEPLGKPEKDSLRENGMYNSDLPLNKRGFDRREKRRKS